MNYFSFKRLWGIIIKEFTQMRRDRMTFAMMVGLPLLQLILFGFAINTDPKNLPTVIVSADDSVFTRNFTIALQNSTYFKILPGVKTYNEASKLLSQGKVQFVIYIPENFSEKLIRNIKPQILVEADATDPSATGNAVEAVQFINTALYENLKGILSYLKPTDSPVDLVIQAKYNPARITQYNIVPGLLGVVLTMTMIVITALAITRERERGTMESLLAMPVRPIEVMLGKLIPYILVGYIQITLILCFSYYLYGIPMQGNVILLLFACLPFIAANLAVGLMFSTLAKNQLQAMQLSFFFFLPSILLSGFMFPFRGMPDWAQIIGNILPLTHFMVIVRGVILKGNLFMDILPAIEAIMAFLLVVLVLGIQRYRQTLD
ncbi:MAG TPA: ABC transporter permease [Gammaproteobacteria bacterium]|jgi:ABC-2 type transport system permease protein|nr:ABC transporter permease [Gammaproteobacteria bacterium]